MTGTLPSRMCFPEPQGLLLSHLFTGARGPVPLPIPSPHFPFLQTVESSYLVFETLSSWGVCVCIYPSLGIHRGADYRTTVDTKLPRCSSCLY